MTTNKNKSGYKKTKVGWIPKEWEMKTIGELGELKSGGTPSTKVQEYWKDEVFWCVPSEFKNLKDKYISSTERMISVLGLNNSNADLIKKNSLIISTRASIGLVAINTVDMTTNQGFKSIEPNNNTTTLYLYFIIKYFENELLTLGKGSTFLEVSKKDLSSLSIPLPPMREQKKIAEILSTWDEAIETTEKLIAAQEQRKKWLMQQLLTGKTRFSGFTGKWKRVEVKEIGDIFNGITGKTKKDFGFGKPYISYLNIFKNAIIKNDQFDLADIKNGENQNQVNNGDLLFTTSSETPHEVGFCSTYIGEVEVYLNSFSFGVRTDKKLCNPIFMSNYFRNQPGRKLMNKLAQGATRYNLSKRYFQLETLLLPPLAEQEKIAEVLSTQDELIEGLQDEKLRLVEQKRGLMQVLLTGAVRV